jgi:alpha-tubulin suppressor-like RCC1 family protein
VGTDGTLWAWGRNDYGQIGDGTRTPYADTPGPLRPVRIGSGFASVAAGYSFTLAVKADGTLWSWGYGHWGELGTGPAAVGTVSLSPAQVGTGFARAAVGLEFSTAVKRDGTLWTWGRNAAGQLGDQTRTDRPSPVQIGTGFDSVASGWACAIATRRDATLWGWGANGSGQLGNGTTTSSGSPVQIPE